MFIVQYLKWYQSLILYLWFVNVALWLILSLLLLSLLLMIQAYVKNTTIIIITIITDIITILTVIIINIISNFHTSWF